MRLLLVEDEIDAARMLARGLRDQAYAVDMAYDGEEAVRKLHASPYDAVILDIMLPRLDGISVCRHMRAHGLATPVLMLTALDQVQHRIAGLDSGADDYLTKPFDFGELLARVRALLRRGPALQDAVLTVDDLVLDTRERTVRRGGQRIELTAKEYALLEYLMRRQGEVVGRSDISEHVWEESYDPFSNLIEVYVQRLRRKLEPEGSTRLIHTRRGEGYRIAAHDDV
jgi:two-component system, OmpR family, copper resistance phosphate regulon response regulator CusR